MKSYYVNRAAKTVTEVEIIDHRLTDIDSNLVEVRTVATSVVLEVSIDDIMDRGPVLDKAGHWLADGWSLPHTVVSASQLKAALKGDHE